MKKKYELHHVHEAAGRNEIQALLNAIPWRALLIRQRRPGQWPVERPSEGHRAH